MEIEIFTLADFAQDNNSKLTIVGTFDSIQSKQFPCVHPACAIATRLRFSEKETGVHDFKLKLNDPAGKEIIPTITGTINVVVPPGGQYSAFNIVVNLNQLKFEKEGRYSFELFIDEDWATGLSLNLIKVS